jgi:uncharacterized protein YkwD
MKSTLVLLFLLTALSSFAVAQGDTALTLDLRPGMSDAAAVGGVTRTRAVETAAALRSPFSSAAGEVERRVFELLNAERRSQGLADLAWSEDVAALARMHSGDMAAIKFFSHRGSDGSMVDERADRLGMGAWRVIGENIAYMRGYPDPAALAVEKWMASPEHRKNLLGPNWKESAVGIAITSDGTYYMTQVFLLRK